MPRKVKYRKRQKGRFDSWHIAGAGTEVSFGRWGLKALDSRRLTARQIEAARRAMTRYVARQGKIWVRVFPDYPVTRKGSEVPMGGGKGAVDHYVVHVSRGRVLFEMDGVSPEMAREALERAAHKLPVRTKIVERAE